MVRQCAWCLRLMNNEGERTSMLPVPKIYEATHGMCQVCGGLWLEQALGNEDVSSQLVVPNQQEMVTETTCSA